MSDQHHGTRFAWVTRYLAGLSAGQKLTAGTLIVVMIATAVWFTNGGNGASRAPKAGGWEVLLDQPFTEANVNSIVDRLRTSSIPCELRNGKIYVPAERKLDALSDLYYSAVLTGPAEGGFDTLVKQMSAWDAPSKTDKLFNRARETMVEQVIARFHGVRKATVLIDPTNERHISGSILPSAMVDIQTEGGGSDASERQLANAAANVLTGAVANLSGDRVKITIDGASFNGAAAAGTASGDLATDTLLAHRQQCEQMQVAKVRQVLAYIPNVLVSVSVDLDMQSVEVEKRFVDPDSTKTQAAAATTLPSSVLANAVPSATSPRLDATATASTSALGSETVQKSHSPAGKETVRSASVVVPRSYFAGLYKRASRKEIEPDDALLAPVVAAHLGKIRGLVRNALGLEDDGDVSVEVYEDSLPTPAPVAAAAVTSSSASVVPTPTAATPPLNWGARVDRQIIYALLGVTMFLTLVMLLRRPKAAVAAAAAVAPVMRVGRPPRHEQVLGGTLVDEVDRRDDDRAVEHEADEEEDGDPEDGDEIEAHDMFRRVRDVVEENPEEAARVLRDWIYQGHQSHQGHRGR